MQRRADPVRLQDLAEDFDLEAVRLPGKLFRDIPDRDAFAHRVTETAGGYPADGLATMEDRLVGDRVDILNIDGQRDQLVFAAATFLLLCQRIPADEAVFRHIDEAVQPGLEG